MPIPTFAVAARGRFNKRRLSCVPWPRPPVPRRSRPAGRHLDRSRPRKESSCLPCCARFRNKLAPLTAALVARDVRARRAAIDVLEALGQEAAPAAPSLVRALADPDRFVRWAAARTLGQLAPEQAATAVPGLARLLSDADLDLRVAA